MTLPAQMWFPPTGAPEAPRARRTRKRLVDRWNDAGPIHYTSPPGASTNREDGLPGGPHPRAIEEATLLYFAYTTRIAPDRMAAAAPSAEFEFIAHLPEWGLEFPVESDAWGGTLPTVTPTTGSTVWGAVFKVDESALEAIDLAEAAEHRVRTTVEAMDRMGRRHQVAVHLHQTNGASNGGVPPSAAYLEIMLDGSRHWSLPAGWIAGLEEHLQSS